MQLNRPGEALRPVELPTPSPTTGEVLVEVSACGVCRTDLHLIDDELPGKVHSDDTIVTLLRADGIDIARRTVAKYREAMGIPSSVQRRREKLHHF